MVILAGGLGTRLRPVLKEQPKCLAPIAGQPFLFWLLDGIARQGIKRVILAVGYKADDVRAAVGDARNGLEITYSNENQPLGTGGAIWASLELCTDERVFVANGDTWSGMPLCRLGQYAPDADVVMTLKTVTDRSRYGSVCMDGDKVTGLSEKGLSGDGAINAGLYVLRRDLATRFPMPQEFSFEKDILSRPTGLNIRACVSSAPFIDIGTPHEFLNAQTLIPQWAQSDGCELP
jgi:D-glycero-alpha-D-manno-heptose 1-phosphate guanylyltransferase